MIVSFKSEETKLIFEGFTSPQFPPNIQKNALRKLLILDAATSINDLRVPPGNRLEKLVGERIGQSIAVLVWMQYTIGHSIAVPLRMVCILCN